MGPEGEPFIPGSLGQLRMGREEGREGGTQGGMMGREGGEGGRKGREGGEGRGVEGGRNIGSP